MRVPSDDAGEFDRAPGLNCDVSRDSDVTNVDERMLDRFLERVSEEGCLTILRWARRYAPDLLNALIVSFLTRASHSELRKTIGQCSMPETSPVTTATTSPVVSTLRDIEQQHIARVIAESPTLNEAASRLGVSPATLWRKRKLYRSRTEERSLDGEPP
jgi:DNA-binding NtrC family response regulator